jgi:hypothetical protein
VAGPSIVAAANLLVTGPQLSATSHTFGSPVTCTLAASGDSYVAKEAAGSNFGTGTTLIVSSSATTTKRSLVQFALIGCSPAIPPTALVTAASLSLTTAALQLGTRTYEVHGISATWTEIGVNWTNQPAAAAGVSGSATVSLGTPSGTTVSWNVIGDVQSMVSGAASNEGWRIVDSSETSFLETTLTLSSRNAASNQPQLVVTYIP